MLNAAKDQRGEVREQIVLSSSCSITTADELGNDWLDWLIKLGIC